MIPILRGAFLGETNGGKSSLLQTQSSKTFQPSLSSTVGNDFTKFSKKDSDGTEIQLEIWDMPGKRRLSPTRISHYRRFQFIGFCISLGSKEQESAIAEELNYWLSEFNQYANEGTLVAIILTQSDLFKRNSISRVKQFETLAREITQKFSRLQFIQKTLVTSAKENNAPLDDFLSEIIAANLPYRYSVDKPPFKPPFIDPKTIIFPPEFKALSLSLENFQAAVEKYFSFSYRFFCCCSVRSQTMRNFIQLSKNCQQSSIEGSILESNLVSEKHDYRQIALSTYQQYCNVELKDLPNEDAIQYSTRTGRIVKRIVIEMLRIQKTLESSAKNVYSGPV